MHVISKKKLRAFWDVHPNARRPLEAWWRVADLAEWENFADLKATYRSADRVGKFVVFNVGGNKFRLVAVIHFNRGKVFIRHVLTHAEYDEGKWQND